MIARVVCWLFSAIFVLVVVIALKDTAKGPFPRPREPLTLQMQANVIGYSIFFAALALLGALA